MLKLVVHSFGLVERSDEDPRRKNKVRGTKTSPHYGLRLKDLYVRIVHQGGQQEVYHHAFPASKLLAKYPGMCVARAQVFMAPHQSVLRPEEHLLLGHKYVIISCRDVEKLKRKHPQHGKTKEHDGEKVNAEMNVSHGGGNVEDVHCTAKDFYVAKDKSARRKGIKAKKPFLPPLPYRGLGWQPSLATVQELSP